MTFQRVQEQEGAKRGATIEVGIIMAVPVPVPVTAMMAESVPAMMAAPVPATPEIASTAAVAGPVAGAMTAEMAPADLDHRGTVGQARGRCRACRPKRRGEPDQCGRGCDCQLHLSDPSSCEGAVRPVFEQ